MKLKESLEKSLPSELLDSLVTGYDLVGDIAITIIPPELERYEQLIGEAILKQNTRIKVVAKRSDLHTGAYRTLPLTVIVGEKRKETICQEYGNKLIVNPEQAYFSIRSGSERKRIADQVKDQEQILVLFSGIAPYPIMLARHSRAGHITGIEMNPEAHLLAVRNVELNKIHNISLFQGDVTEVVHTLTARFDRIIMPLPHKAVSFLPQALSVLKSGGMIHLYAFQEKKEEISCLPEITEICRTAAREPVGASLFFCGHPSPSQYRVCIDARID
jgi:tRNA (guanine37-N1)-methyltransferase